MTDFVALDEIDPIYYERTYWLVPDGDPGKKAYQLLLAAMEERQRVAIGTVVMRNKQYLTAIRPLDAALAMSTMRFADEVVPKADIDGLPRRAKPDTKTLKMATQLLDALGDRLEPQAVPRHLHRGAAPAHRGQGRRRGGRRGGAGRGGARQGGRPDGRSRSQRGEGAGQPARRRASASRRDASSSHATMGRVQDTVSRLLRANEGYVAARSTVGSARPGRRLAVVTCMDNRIDVYAALGLHLGDAHVIRNAGGRVTGDVLRSLAVSIHLLGVETVIVMQHTKCGLAGVTEEKLRAVTGADLGFLAFDDHAVALHEDIDRLTATPVPWAVADGRRVRLRRRHGGGRRRGALGARVGAGPSGARRARVLTMLRIAQ